MNGSMWKCDYKGCEDTAQWYREYKSELFKLCTKHEAYFQNKHWGRHVDYSRLSEDDISYLKEKEQWQEEARENPFDELLFRSENGTYKIRVIDRRTDETRSLTIKDEEYDIFLEVFRQLRKKKPLAKYSIDDYVEGLRKGLQGELE